MYIKTCLSLFLCFLTASACAGQVSPVSIGGSEEVDACSATGQVHGLKATGDGFLAVRRGPQITSDKIDEIFNGQIVYVCDYSEDGKWLGIVYSLSTEDNCGVASPSIKKRAYEGSCKVGWVSAKWIKIVAG